MSIKEDLELYPCYLFRNKRLIKLKEPPDNWFGFQTHHFVRKSIRKNSLDFYKKIEHLQKIIFVPTQMNYDLESMGEVKFFEKYGVDKNLLVFSRLKWREGFYEDHRETKTDN